MLMKHMEIDYHGLEGIDKRLINLKFPSDENSLSKSKRAKLYKWKVLVKYLCREILAFLFIVYFLLVANCVSLEPNVGPK